MKLISKNIVLRTVELKDASFIYKMRQNKSKTKYLSQVDGTLQDQENWIQKYKEREKDNQEFYFVIEKKDQEKLGLIRIYDLKDDSFCWGSWLIKNDAPKYTAIESALQIYEFGFYKLKFNNSHFDVRKNNIKVVAFHKRFGAEIVYENELDYFFIFKKETYEKTKKRYRRYF